MATLMARNSKLNGRGWVYDSWYIGKMSENNTEGYVVAAIEIHVT